MLAVPWLSIEPNLASISVHIDMAVTALTGKGLHLLHSYLAFMKGPSWGATRQHDVGPKFVGCPQSKVSAKEWK